MRGERVLPEGPCAKPLREEQGLHEVLQVVDTVTAVYAVLVRWTYVVEPLQQLRAGAEVVQVLLRQLPWQL